MRITRLFILFFVLFAFAASAHSQTDSAKTKKKKNTSTKRVFKSYKGCKKKDDNCTYFQLSYQVINSGSAKDVINEKIQDSLLSAVNFFPDMNAKDFKTAAGNFIAMYDSSLAEQTNGAPWYMETNGKVHYSGKNVLSYGIGQFMYTGGAHPNTYLAYFNYDKTSGNQISLNDVFGAGWEAPLNKIVDTEFRKMKGLSATDNLQEKAGLFENKITYTNNFAFEKKGITFYYNSYDIAAYAYGPTDLFIPWSALSDILPDASYYK